MKILTILGARPQFIKAAAFSRSLKKFSTVTEVIVHTGQHFDSQMSDIFFEEMTIPEPNYFLDINGISHGAMTGRMLEKIEDVILKEKPDWVLVFGDTNSTLAGALAASKLHVKVAHIEAGLRSFNMDMPEEINRIVTDRLSSLLFCPTGNAILNLEKEGFKNFNCSIVRTGDIMLDAALYYKDHAASHAKLFSQPPSEKFILATIHRQENTDDKARLSSILEALNEISKSCKVILPLHPRTRKKISEFGLVSNVTITDPLGYFDMLQLLNSCHLVMTDSGGLQKEAYFFKKPCITLRDQTEWIELVEANVNVLVGADNSKIINTFANHKYNLNGFEAGLYGNGNASEKIIEAMLNFKN
jgi:UDP-GlcNAc3NAcA epimerase